MKFSAIEQRTPVFCPLLAIAFLLILFGSSHAQPQDGAIYEKAEKEYREGRFTEAIASFSAYIKSHPKSAMAVYKRGFAYFRAKRFSEAVKDFSSFIQSNPTSATGYLARGEVYSEWSLQDSSFGSAAVIDLSKAIELDPKSASAYYERGLVYFNRAEYSRAEEDLRRSIEILPKFPQGHRYLGLALHYQNKTAAAKQSLTTFRELSLDKSDANRLLEMVNGNRQTAGTRSGGTPVASPSPSIARTSPPQSNSANGVVSPTPKPQMRTTPAITPNSQKAVPSATNATIERLLAEKRAIPLKGTDSRSQFRLDVQRALISSSLSVSFLSISDKINAIGACGALGDVINSQNAVMDDVIKIMNKFKSAPNERARHFSEGYAYLLTVNETYNSLVAATKTCEMAINANKDNPIASSVVSILSSLSSTYITAASQIFYYTGLFGDGVATFISALSEANRSASVFSANSPAGNITPPDRTKLIGYLTRSVEIRPNRAAYELRSKVYRKMGNNDAANADAMNALKSAN